METPSRPRQAAAVLVTVLLLAASHAATTGPVYYAECRGWIPSEWSKGFRSPEDWAFASGEGYRRYLAWWGDQGYAASCPVPQGDGSAERGAP